VYTNRDRDAIIATLRSNKHYSSLYIHTYEPVLKASRFTMEIVSIHIYNIYMHTYIHEHITNREYFTCIHTYMNIYTNRDRMQSSPPYAVTSTTAVSLGSGMTRRASAN
jgi:hypothetical protein